MRTLQLARARAYTSANFNCHMLVRVCKLVISYPELLLQIFSAGTIMHLKYDNSTATVLEWFNISLGAR